MILCKANYSFPVVTLPVRVEYSTPRPLTVFEWALLRVAEQFSNAQPWNEAPLKSLFEKFFQVADPTPLLDPILHELVRSGGLKCDTIQAGVDSLKPRDLGLTERGRRMLSDGQLPGTPRAHEASYFYDPVRDLILRPAEARLILSAPKGLAVDGEPFREVWPVDKIRDEQRKNAWWTPSCQIESIQRIEGRDTALRWLQFEASVEVEGSDLSLRFKNEKQSQYLANLPEEVCWDRYLQPLLAPKLAAGIRRRSLLPGDLASFQREVGIRAPLDEVNLLEALLKGRWIVDGAGWTASPEDPRSGCIQIRLGAPAATQPVGIRWNKARDGGVVEIPGMTKGWEGVLIGPRHRLQLYEVPLRWGGKAREATLIREETNRSPEIERALDQLGVAVRGLGPELAVLPALWEKPAIFWRQWLENRRARRLSWEMILQEWPKTLQQYAEFPGGGAGPEGESMTLAALECLLQADPGPSTLEDWERFSQVTASWWPNQPAPRSRLQRMLLEKLPAPANLAEFGRLAVLGQGLNASNVIPFPGRWYSEAVVREVAQTFRKPATRAILASSNPFDAGIRRLAELADQIDSVAVSHGGMNPAAPPNRPGTGPVPTPLAEVAKWADEWLSRWQWLSAKAHALGTPGTAIATMAQDLRQRFPRAAGTPKSVKPTAGNGKHSHRKEKS